MFGLLPTTTDATVKRNVCITMAGGSTHEFTRKSVNTRIFFLKIFFANAGALDDFLHRFDTCRGLVRCRVDVLRIRGVYMFFPRLIFFIFITFASQSAPYICNRTLGPFGFLHAANRFRRQRHLAPVPALDRHGPGKVPERAKIAESENWRTQN